MAPYIHIVSSVCSGKHEQARAEDGEQIEMRNIHVRGSRESEASYIRSKTFFLSLCISFRWRRLSRLKGLFHAAAREGFKGRVSQNIFILS